MAEITAGKRGGYASRSLEWTAPSTRSEDEYLQRIYNLANDVLALEEELAQRDRELADSEKACDVQTRRLKAIEMVIAHPEHYKP